MNELLREIPKRLNQSVTRQLVSDVQLGAFLSGGIDSSSVVAMMCQAGGKNVKTFSIGYAEKDFDETRYAKMVAERYETDHYQLHTLPTFPKFLGSY